MNENNSLNRDLPIPQIVNNQQTELQLHQQIQSPTLQVDSHSLNRHIRRSTHSVSSLSQATNQSVVPINTNHVESFDQVISVCNEIDVEDACFATETLVRKCIKNEIWATNKFVTDNTIKKMNIKNRTNTRSVLNILLKHTRKEALDDIKRLRFWKRYGPMVQTEINVMKTICTRSIKDEIMIGTYIITFNYMI